MKYTVNTENNTIELETFNPLKMTDLKEKLSELEKMFPEYEISLITPPYVKYPFIQPFNKPNIQPYDDKWNQTTPFVPLNLEIIYYTTPTYSIYSNKKT